MQDLVRGLTNFHLSELINNNRNFQILTIIQNMINKCSFAAPQKTCNDGYGFSPSRRDNSVGMNLLDSIEHRFLLLSNCEFLG